jgi:hypothetical protein
MCRESLRHGHVQVMAEAVKVMKPIYCEKRPLFRVGDRVKVKSPGMYYREQGLVMEIAEHSDDDISYCIRFPEWKTATFSETELALV